MISLKRAKIKGQEFKFIYFGVTVIFMNITAKMFRVAKEFQRKNTTYSALNSRAAARDRIDVVNNAYYMQITDSHIAQNPLF